MMGGNKPRGGSAKERSVFVGNIPYDVTEEQLKEIFSEAGSVVNFRLVTDRETGKPKGYGFCEYADGATALSAMRNLNGFEVNGRNLRVDFADGGDKSGGGGGGGGGGHGGGHGGGGGGDRGYHHQQRDQFSHHQYQQQQPGVSGEMAIKAIETAISKAGPLKLYDMLVALKEHARQKPEHTKGMLSANPALTHAIVQAFKSLQIPLPSPAETQAALMPPMVMAGRVMLPAPMQRAPPMGPPVSGVLGMGPPPGPPMHSTAPPPAPAPAKAGGTRWSARPGPLSTQIAAPAASSAANLVVTPTASSSGLMSTPSAGLMAAPVSSGLMAATSAPVGGLLPPPSRSQPLPQAASSILGPAPPQVSSSILGMPPQASSSILGLPPQASTSTYGAPPQASSSILGAPPRAISSTVRLPPQASSSVLGPPPQASSSIYGAPPQASSSILGQPPQASSSVLGMPPQASSSILGGPPQVASSVLGPPPSQLPAASRNRDPRARARDPRLAKRGFEPAAPAPLADPVKRQRPIDHGPPAFSNGAAEFDAIAELARDMTPEKLDMLPPEERQMLIGFMQQNNIPFHGR